jgi:hypothetical protein
MRGMLSNKTADANSNTDTNRYSNGTNINTNGNSNISTNANRGSAGKASAMGLDHRRDHRGDCRRRSRVLLLHEEVTKAKATYVTQTKNRKM